MPGEITDLKVSLISLVKAGANKKTIIYKNENFCEMLRVDFKKQDDEGVVYGIVYAPDEVDTQGDFANADTIKKAAYAFMKNTDLNCVDVNHDFNRVDAYICESWIVKSKDEFFDEVGAWAVGIKLDDEKLKEMVKSGEITGLSMYGTGVKKESLSAAIKNAMSEFFKKENKEVQKEEVQKDEVIKAIESGFSEIVKTNNQKIDLLEKNISELSKEMSSLKATMSKSKQDESIRKNENDSGGIL